MGQGRKPGGELTGRESQVAALVADGLANKQIALLLGIAVRTAESHVENILIKWGLRSRVQIALRVGETVRLHERTMLVQQANTEMTCRLWDVQDVLRLTYAEMLVAVATRQANIARIILGKDRVAATVPGYAEVAAATTEVQQERELTDVELLGLLAEHQQRIAKYMLREERHPGNPDIKADEADDN